MRFTGQAAALTAALATAGVLAACGGGGGDTGGTGTLNASLTDGPACGFDQVNVTVNKVRVNKSDSANENDGAWSDITLNPARKINLLNLTNGVLADLGQTTLPAGRYNQIRLLLSPNNGNATANSVVLEGANTEIALNTPSAVQSGIKLNGQFDVVAGQRTDILLDFDACSSIVKRGNGSYGLKPVIAMIPYTMNGITGYVAPNMTHAVVSAQQNGQIIRSTLPDANGQFNLARLPVGNYDVVITADNRSTTVVGAVPVSSTTSTTTLSTSAAPITPTLATSQSASGTVSLSPVSTDAAPVVTAQQSFSGGPKVTVKFQNVDVTNGSYSIATLPVTAPSYAQFTTTLPLNFASANNTTPGTGKYSFVASATGYTTSQPLTVDLTTTSQTNVNFNLAQ